MTSRDTELAHVLRQVAQTCEALAERVQLDRIERSALVDAVEPTHDHARDRGHDAGSAVPDRDRRDDRSGPRSRAGGDPDA